MLNAESAEQAHRLYDGLSAGGTRAMPLQAVEWSELYGIATDRFGVQWGIDYTGNVKFALPQGG